MVKNQKEYGLNYTYILTISETLRSAPLHNSNLTIECSVCKYILVTCNSVCPFHIVKQYKCIIRYCISYCYNVVNVITLKVGIQYNTTQLENN